TVVHLVSAGLWAGGILALALQRPPGGWRGTEGRRLLGRFSPVALAAFAVTAATGLLEGTEELSGLRDLVASGYGQVLALKGGAVLLMLPLSVLAWRRVLPKPRLEAGLALVVVAASGLLAAFPLPPARLQEAQACRAADVDVRGGETLTVTAGAGSATFRVPQLPAADAGALLGRALQRMHDLRTFRLDETLMPARAPLSVTYAFQAPDRLSYQVSGGGQTVIVGSTQYTRDGPAAPWKAETLPPVPVPSFVWDGSPTVAPHALGD